MLDWIPGRSDPSPSPVKLEAILEILVQPLENISKAKHLTCGARCFEPRWDIVWVWQSPVMLTSWSCVLFFAALILHILTPVIPVHKPSDNVVRLLYALSARKLTDFIGRKWH